MRHVLRPSTPGEKTRRARSRVAKNTRRWRLPTRPGWTPGRCRGTSRSDPMALDFGINTGFVEELYAQYLENPESVDPSWRSFFDGRLGSTNGGSELLRRAPGLPLTNGHLARSLDLTFQQHAAVTP